jgi:flagellar export protein FliJ
MPFRFRLAKVLKVRQRVLDQRARDVAAADRVRQQFVEREQQLAASYARLAGTKPAAAGATLDVRDLAEQALRLRRLAELRAEAARDTKLATLALDRERTRLTEAWRDVEVLKKLEDRRREQWEEEQRRQESRQLDEVGGIRADRLKRSRISA